MNTDLKGWISLIHHEEHKGHGDYIEKSLKKVEEIL
jgi:hypothetical protein